MLNTLKAIQYSTHRKLFWSPTFCLVEIEQWPERGTPVIELFLFLLQLSLKGTNQKAPCLLIKRPAALIAPLRASSASLQSLRNYSLCGPKQPRPVSWTAMNTCSKPSATSLPQFSRHCPSLPALWAADGESQDLVHGPAPSLWH